MGRIERSHSPAIEPFTVEDLRGEIASAYLPADLSKELGRVLDPAAAEETLHWGRNYLYRTRWNAQQGPVQVVVKQFRNESRKDRLRKDRGQSKAARSWRAALAFQGAGVPTAEGVLLAESKRPDGPSFFVSLFLPGVLEVRYPLRSLRAGTWEDDYPGLDREAFLTAMGAALAKMHAAGLFHRDLSIGNLLIQKTGTDGDGRDRFDLDRLYLIDLNRSRQRGNLGPGTRTRDLCRLAIFEPEHQETFLRGYWGDGQVTPSRRRLYRLYHRSFLFKIEGKKRLRGRIKSFFGGLRSRSTHVHIPDAPDGAQERDRIVWDHLSDQPHLHAGRWTKLKVRLADTGSHLRFATSLARGFPSVWHRFRHLERRLHTEPVPWQGVGACLRPHPDNPEALMQAVEELGLNHFLLRLHPWEEQHGDELSLARELQARGYTLAFSLPQNRELVSDPERWRSKVEELVELFSPYGKSFQVGQAINRSKWGVWNYSEFLKLAGIAREILDRHPGTEMVGPGVIDFELHATIGVLAMAQRLPGGGLPFDALASLLYVDRRGAPENAQLGFDTIRKVLLAQAIAEAAPNCAPRSWITEVNWPLREGPHSPAGKAVSVDEETQADYLSRFYLLALATGQAERVYWWQLIARGYGLATAEPDGTLRRRPSFDALATLERQLHGSTFQKPLESPPGTHLYPFLHPNGHTILAAWCEEGTVDIEAPGQVLETIGRGGEGLPSPGQELKLSPSVRYVRLS